ncbi:MAG TPA: hypothetical protein VIV11_39945 [Kofleriaceae bacterium]
MGMARGFVLAGSVALAACIGMSTHRPRVPQPEDDLPLPPPAEPAARIPGPLSLVTKYPEPAWSDVQRTRRQRDERYIGKRIMRDDVAAYLALVDEFYAARTPAQKDAHQYAREQLALLEKLAPYALESTLGGFHGVSQRFGLCVRTHDVMAHCDYEFKPPPSAPVPFELTTVAPGIVSLRILDLSNANDPAWAKFPVGELRRAKAILLDMRGATGTDPRPLIPWLESVTGIKPLKPLRAVERPASADKYVAAYAARFVPESRDAAVWASLVGNEPARAAPSAKPIAIVVGRHCGAACELIARVLETYAGATVTGSAVPTSGRLARDEPALLTLPHTKLAVFFHATRYVLAPEIEAATGPSDLWTSAVLGGDPIDGDTTPFAVRELTARLAGGWPRCDSFRTYRSVAELTPEMHQKLQMAQWLDASMCTRTPRRVQLRAQAPQSAIRRYLTTCAGPISIEQHWYVTNNFELVVPKGMAALGPLSQLAQSPLVESIAIECEQEVHFELDSD